MNETDPQAIEELYNRIYDLTVQVPAGYVTTYGALGKIAGCSAQEVGYAMNEVSARKRPDVPWQRVINSKGMISTRGPRQRQLLESEGIVFDAKDRIDLKRYGWNFGEPGGADGAAQLSLF